jgi:hypothetical protein
MDSWLADEKLVVPGPLPDSRSTFERKRDARCAIHDW